jgi:sulfatase modifying factor 1
MISVRGVARAAVVVALVMLAAGAVRADTAPWPTNWNNWNDPALWVTVGNPGNVADQQWASPGYGAVTYTYNIGKYEVTAGQYTAFLNAVAKTDTYGLYNTNMSRTDYGSGIGRIGLSGNYIYGTVDANFVNRPVNYVSFWDACRFANWLHNGQRTGAQDAGTTERGAYTLDGYNGGDGWTIRRSADAKYAVPSEDEWYKAAYYNAATATYFDYPTSSDTAPGRDMADASGNNANYYTGSGNYPIDSGKYTTVAGEFQNSDSPYGTFDQGGNVLEWNDTGVLSGSGWSLRGVRGGSFDYPDWKVIAAYRGGAGPANENEDNRYGFRVAEVPEPATLGLLALGGLLALRRRR